ncbi:MAG: heme-binding protein, partial [Gammaproteobacteria bacterium]|nr:heme-binding protein [Gammaproteobacteria bacterium]
MAALRLPLFVFVCLITGCGGSGPSPAPVVAGPGPPPPDAGCDGSCAGPTSFLSIGDVQTVIAQAVAEAQARNAEATIAVVDRVGNVLGVFRMLDADELITISSTPPGNQISGGLEGIFIIPDTMAAISKAVTGAYLASEGNAFTTRTASQIVQEHFNPGEAFQASGPLFGVQFSQLACSDFFTDRFMGGTSTLPGPHRSPLGLSADSGGIPLYRGGTPIGGVGVIADSIYGLDKDPTGDVDMDIDELIALAGTAGFEPPADRLASRITADGKTFRFTDARFDDLLSSPASAPGFDTVNNISGKLVLVRGYYDGGNPTPDPPNPDPDLGPPNDRVVLAGTAFGQPASGVRPDTLDYPGRDAFVLVDANNVERFRPRDGTDGADALTAEEARTLTDSALDVANRARAQIRRPLGTPARVTISVVDTNGVPLAIARTRDAPIFGTDVSLQKARTAAFFSSASAAAALSALPLTAYVNGTPLNPDGTPFSAPLRVVDIGNYVSAAQSFLGVPTALADGAFAFSDRAGGNLSRPFYPDGIDAAPHGPFSKRAGRWSPFSVGLQLDLVYNAIIHHVAFVLGLLPLDVGIGCTGVTGFDAPAPFTPAPPTVTSLLANGIQIFPGSVPVYRGETLVGGIGISGDGVDQDDMIAFLGLHEAGVALGTINNAPVARRADNLTPM